MKTIYYTAVSLDGFLATMDDDVSWLDQMPQQTDDTYTPFINSVGAICMGSASYEFVLRHMEKGVEWPYQQPTWIFTTRDLEIPDGVDARLVQGSVKDAHQEMAAAASGKNVWVVGGGDLAGQFLDARLLDELIISVASVTLGTGKPLLPRPTELRLQSAKSLGEGFVQLCYKPV